MKDKEELEKNVMCCSIELSGAPRRDTVTRACGYRVMHVHWSDLFGIMAW